MGWDDAWRHLRWHGGVDRITEVAAAGGLAPSTVRRRADREGWPQPFPGVVAHPGAPLDSHLWARAALAYLGPPAALTRWSALHHLGVWRSPPSRVQVLVPVARRGDLPGRLEVVRTRTWSAAELGEGTPTCASPVRVVCDLAAVTDVATLRDRTIDLVQRRHLALGDLQDRVVDGPRFVGRGRVREVLAQLDAAGRTDAPIELQVRRRLARAGVHLDRGQVPVPCIDGRVRHLDLGIARLRFGIEVDSMLAHSTRPQLEADVRRTNGLALAEAPWRVLRVTWRDLDDDRWDDVVTMVREALALQRQRWEP